MLLKRLLIIIPISISIILIQSYFWVPSYEEQTVGNPSRLGEYISASIGDAHILNPILAADSASAEINNLVFDGLLDRDKDLMFRGRIAESWELFEEARFYIPEDESPQEIINKLEYARLNYHNFSDKLADILAQIISIELELPEARHFKQELSDTGIVEIEVSAPAALKLTLKSVEQDLFIFLEEILGDGFFNKLKSDSLINVAPPVSNKEKQKLNEELLPPFEHNPVLIFHIRKNVYFHDNHPVEAKDIKFTYESIVNPKNLSPRVADYEPVKAVEIIGPHTVKITYKRLYSPAIGSWSMGILPEHLLNDDMLKKEAESKGLAPDKFTMRDSDFNRFPIGCGPFKFREWKSDQYIALDRFNDYWEGSPNYDKYFYRIIPDLLTQEMEFYAGAVDAYYVQPYQVERFSKDERFQSFSGTSFSYTYIAYNMRREPFNDIRIRKALGMAVNVDQIIDYVLYSQGERITGPFLKQTDYYDSSIKPIPYDPEGALKLLKDAGWEKGDDGFLRKNGKLLEFTLITNSGNDLRKAILAIAQNAWRNIGINVHTDIIEWSVFLQEKVNKADFDALILGWSMGIDPDLYQIWHSSQTNQNQLNFVGYNNKDADDLIVRIRREYDHDESVRMCHQLHRIISEDQPYTFLYMSKWTAILDKKIVIRETDEAGEFVFKKITPTKTGSYLYDFNKWIKLPEAINFDIK